MQTIISCFSYKIDFIFFLLELTCEKINIKKKELLINIFN